MTPQQARVLQFLRERLQAGPVCPSYQEIAVGIGMSANSKGAVHQIIARLERDGHVMRVAGSKRGLRVVQPSPHALDAGALVPGALNAGELAWCHAHADAVRRFRVWLDARGGH